MTIQEAYEDLANAIIIQAVKDYRKTLTDLKKTPYCYELLSRKRSIIVFFHSQWFSCLTDLNCERILEKLKEEE